MKRSRRPRDHQAAADRPNGVGRLRRPADTTLPCCELFSAQLIRRGLTREQLGSDTGLTAPTIYRALDGGSISPNVAVRIAHVLGIDVGHVALATFRDEIRSLTSGVRKRAGLKPSTARPGDVSDEQLLAMWNDSIAQLTTHLAWQVSPYAASGTGRRLELKRYRLASNNPVSRRAVATEMATTIAPQDRDSAGARLIAALERELKGYEHDLIALSEDRLRLWLRAIGRARGEAPISLEQLTQRAPELKYVHRMSTTAETNRLRDAPGMAQRVFQPRVGGIELITMPTIFAGVNVEILETKNPEGDRAVILNARHRGLEIAHVAGGAVRLTLSRKPLDPDDELAGRNAPIHGTELGKLREVVFEEVIRESEVVSFASGFYHRAEMIGTNVKIVSTNLTRNLWLGRRYRGDLTP